MPDNSDYFDFEEDIHDFDEDGFEARVWNLLVLINPGDEDTALRQFDLLRERLAAGDDQPLPWLLRDIVDWTSGFFVGPDDIDATMEALDELAARWRVRIDWPLDDDGGGAPDTAVLLQAAFVELRERHFCLWTVETGEPTLAGWITRERDMEGMQLIAGALGMPARPGAG